MSRRVDGWRAWFTEGRIFDSNGTEWQKLPKDGLLFLCLYMNWRSSNGFHYREMKQGEDYYWHVPPDVFGHCSEKEMTPNEICQRYPGALIIRGQWSSTEEYERTKTEATKSRWL